MNVRAALRRPAFAIALGSAVLVWLVLIVIGAYVVNHGERATLDAAGAAVRARLAGAPELAVRSSIGELASSAARWNAAIAAFDGTGRFIGGDPSLRGDGLRADGAATPPSGRLLAFVQTRDGYVLIAPAENYVVLLRSYVIGTFFIAIVLALFVTWLAMRLWIADRVGSSRRVCASLASLDGSAARTIASADDPLFAEVAGAALAALERVRLASSERAQNEERLRAFLADAGHELRTPLAIAIGYVGILERDAIEDATLARRIVGDIALEHARLQRLVDGILQLARLDAVAGDPNATCDAVRLAHEAVALVRPLALERTIEITAPNAAWVALGSDDLRDALRNLLENAIRYAPQSPVALEIARGESETLVRVSDDGPGMDAFAASHAFDRFFRGSQSGSTAGTGLGLAIVRRIVERAGGEAALRSVSDKGTVVELRLPNAAST